MKVLYDPEYVSDETIMELQSAVIAIREIAVGMTFIADVFHEDPGHKKLTEETFSRGLDTLSAYRENIEAPLMRLDDVIGALEASKKWMEPSAYAGERPPERQREDATAEDNNGEASNV